LKETRFPKEISKKERKGKREKEELPTRYIIIQLDKVLDSGIINVGEYAKSVSWLLHIKEKAAARERRKARNE